MELSQEHIDNILSRKRRPSNPGSVLLDIIEDEDNDYTVESFAQNLDITIDHLENIIKGTVQIDYKLAEHLGNVLGNGPESWLNLQESVNIWDKHNAV
jgi:antitoxin HigA-1